MKFEDWMEHTFDEPDWNEGWNRGDMEQAYEAGRNSMMKFVNQADMPKIVEEKLREALGLALQYVPAESNDILVQLEIDLIHRLINVATGG